MDRRPREFESAALELDHLHTDTGRLAERAARRATTKKQRGAIGISLMLAALLFAGGAMFSAAGGTTAADDPAANSVRAIAGAPAFDGGAGPSLKGSLVDIAAKPDGRGYWTVGTDGGVFTHGNAKFYGSLGDTQLAEPITAMASTNSGNGYWLAAADGGVFTFGDATFHGSLAHPGATKLAAPVVAMARTPRGNGYWLVAADGGVFAFGDATFHGAATSIPHKAPIIAIAPTRSGFGYFLLALDGGVYSFGDAKFRGAAVKGNGYATGIAVPTNGRGYMVARTDGSVTGFGGAPSIAAPFDMKTGQHPVIGIAARRGGGAWLALTWSAPANVAAPASQAGPSQHPFLKCTRAHESDTAGGYQAHSPDGLYHGAYQFLQSTWNNVARMAGRPDLIGVNPANASVADQDALAMWLYNHSGKGPWGGRC
jgi:hypothetical protein